MKKAISERDFKTFAETTMKVTVFIPYPVFVSCLVLYQLRVENRTYKFTAFYTIAFLVQNVL